MMRVACLLVPDLPLHAELRASPELLGTPLVITSGPGNRAEILAASPEATRQGVSPGQTLPQARAVYPEIEARVASPVLERTAREALLDVALSLAPRAELADRASGPFASEGAVFVDASGIEALHGKPAERTTPKGETSLSSESVFASLLHARAARAGIHGFVALAASRTTARLAARDLSFNARHTTQPAEEIEPTRVLPPGRELDFLAPLPIDLLDPDDRTAQTLTRFGIHRIGDLLRLPRRDLAARLGPDLLALVARARGEEQEPPLPEPRTTVLEEGQDLEAPVASLEPLAFVLRGLVSRLIRRLDLRGLGCAELRLTMLLENGARQGRRIGVASPCQNERVLLRLLRFAIERDPPTAPVDGVRLHCDGVALRREQLDLFLPRGPSPSELDQTLAELGAICGKDRVGSPEIVDDHRPNAFALKPFRRDFRHEKSRTRPKTSTQSRPTAPPQRRARSALTIGPRLVMRALRPPLRAEVRLVRGRPAHLQSAIGRGAIVRSAGPWRTTGHWWAESARFAVDHYDVEMVDGTVLRVGFDWKTKRWLVDGLYD